MYRRYRIFAIALGVMLLLVIVAVGPFFPSESIVYPTDIANVPPVRREASKRAKLPDHVEHYLPRETAAEPVMLQASPIGAAESLALDPEIVTKAKAFLESHDHSEASQKQMIDRGFQQYLGRSPSDSEAQAGLQTLREYLSR